MLEFFKRLFGSKPVESAPVPYKVEKPAEFPFPSVKPVETKKKPAVKKPAIKNKPVRKTRAPKA